MDNTAQWIKGIPYEVAFWESYYGNRRRRSDLFSWSLYGKECELDNFDMSRFMERHAVDSALVLDVGCALSYAFGTKLDGRDMTVDFVDPLAVFYNSILDRHKIDRPRIKFGMVESLGASYPENSVTFIHIRNALDHCADPMAGILQAVDCLEPGGMLYINHFRNEAMREGYRGFHQYNIDIDGGRLVIWNKTSCIDVAARLEGFATVQPSVTGEGRIVAVIEKTAPVPGSVLDREKARRDMAEMMMATVRYFHNPLSALAYQGSRIYSAAGHRLMRLLPYSLMNRIKALLGKKSG